MLRNPCWEFIQVNPDKKWNYDWLSDHQMILLIQKIDFFFAKTDIELSQKCLSMNEYTSRNPSPICILTKCWT